MLIRLCTHETATILDPFNGSGTTGLAAISTNRKYIGFEIEKKYYDVSQERLKNLLETLEFEKQNIELFDYNPQKVA